jgi:membrane protein implicated in regulation of membrane protease activity
MADQRLIGKEGVVTGRVAPDTVGEVLVRVRGSSECFLAHPAEGETIPTQTRVVVLDYWPPRTVVVSPCLP